MIRADGLGVKYSLRLTRKQTIRDSLDPAGQAASATPTSGRFATPRSRWSTASPLGVIGPNGAGKSTLLQVLAGILMPSEGVIEVDGHISSLLTLGVGFDEDLSGIDNIRLAGAFMGIDHRVIEDRLPAIIDYAEIGQFIDAPIKTYSAGMRARLGFAIATSVEPDILLLDEVLATGDAAFREKSKARVLELVREAKAIVLVTHDMQWVEEYCNRAILIEQGRIVHQGPPAEVVELHKEHMAQRRAEAKELGVLRLRPTARRPAAAGADGPLSPSGAPPRSPPASRAAATRPRANARADRERAAPVEQRADVARTPAGRSSREPRSDG